MTSDARVVIASVPSGVRGLDSVLGGGLPEYSFTVIAGGPGSGKTTLAQQIVFSAGTEERPALFFTVLGEPALKMLRYQSQFDFFDAEKIGTAVRFINLTDDVAKQDFEAVLARIVSEVERAKPSIVVVDSFRTLSQPLIGSSVFGDLDLARFIQRLAQHLTTWEVTSFLLGEYTETEYSGPLFTVADNVLWLSQVTDRNSVVRKLHVMKSRGRGAMPGLHTFRITSGGLQVFPRIPDLHKQRRRQSEDRQGSGVPGLDEMLGGGIPCGDAVMIAGPAGSGKTTFATQFIYEGLRVGDGVVVAVFEEYPEEYLARARARGHDFESAIASGKLKLIYLRPLDLSVDETLAEILEAVDAVTATRVVIDSLSGFEIALAPSFREDFKESLYRLVGALTATGVTVFMTSEIVGGFPDVRVSTEKVSFITDDIIVQRFVEIGGELKRIVSVTKMRGSDHSHTFRLYNITNEGAAVGGTLIEYHGIMSGMPGLLPRLPRVGFTGLTDREAALLDALVRLGGSSKEAVAANVSMAPQELAESLARLVALGYATHESTGPDQSSYRAVAQPRT
jgi:circadian clock protein KaiC